MDAKQKSSDLLIQDTTAILSELETKKLVGLGYSPDRSIPNDTIGMQRHRHSKPHKSELRSFRVSLVSHQPDKVFR